LLGIVEVMDVREVIIADIMDVWDCGKMDIVVIIISLGVISIINS
ncbi:10449_t:CDS:1, partial [Diversispora eburnea]